MTKLLMVTENTVIRLYNEFRWGPKTLNATHNEVITMVIDEIMRKLTSNNSKHPLKELFLSEDDKGPYYELIYFIFTTINAHAKEMRIQQ